MKENRASRKFADLIWQASSKWPNWDPPIPIKVGDIGRIHKETGVFEAEGNIYEPGFRFRADNPGIASIEPPEVSQPEQTMIITSRVATTNSFSVRPSGEIPGIAEFGFNCEWQFSRIHRGAVLAIAQPQQTYMSRTTDADVLVNIPALRGKVLVTSTISCFAYAFYLSNTSSDKLKLKLHGKVAVPGAPIGARGSFSAEWQKDTGSGTYRDAVHDQFDLTPLFTVKTIDKPFINMRRDSPSPERHGLDRLPDFRTEWEPLDESGEEDEVVV
jgi:hypothetical protein